MYPLLSRRIPEADKYESPPDNAGCDILGESFLIPTKSFVILNLCSSNPKS